MAATGDLVEARVSVERSLAIVEATLGVDAAEVAATLVDLADLQRALGEPAKARALLERAAAICEATSQPDISRDVLVALARLHLGERRPRDALPLLERAVAILDSTDARSGEASSTRFELARTIAATHGDRARAVALARRAREDWRAEGRAAELAEVERWLATSGGG